MFWKVSDRFNIAIKLWTGPFDQKSLKFYIFWTNKSHMDGSKDNDKTASTDVLNKTIIKKALPTESFIFTAEAHVIDRALSTLSRKANINILRLAFCLSIIKQ